MGLIPSVPKKISDEINVGVAEVNQWLWLEESGQWLENVETAHLVLASGKLVLQKNRESRERTDPLKKCLERGLTN